MAATQREKSGLPKDLDQDTHCTTFQGITSKISFNSPTIRPVNHSVSGGHVSSDLDWPVSADDVADVSADGGESGAEVISRLCGILKLE